MQKFPGFYALVAVLFCVAYMPLKANAHPQFEQAKSRIFTQPYTNMPHYKVSNKHFGKAGNHPDNHLLSAARRTLTSKADFITRAEPQKLLNANGVCFAGRWEISEKSDFTGLFEQGSQIPVIARASVALTGTTQKNKRAFGMALKLFPHKEAVSRNILVLNSLVGVRTKHVLDLTMDNQPSTQGVPPWSQLSTALRLRKDLSRADKEHGGKAQLAYRTVDHIAAPALTQSEPIIDHDVVAPYWFRLRADESIPRVDANDFRDELNVKHYPDNMIKWQIEVASNNEIKNKKDADWQLIGQLILTESVISKVCDIDLHFSHPQAQLEKQQD